MVHHRLIPKSGQLYGKVAELLPDVLYFASFESPPSSDAEVRYVNIDERVHYEPFYTDFGPLNLSVLYRFCKFLHGLVEAKSKRKLCFYTDSNDENRVNGACLLASYVMIFQGVSADQAYLKLEAAQGPEFVGFRDAAMGDPTYLLHIHDVLRGIEKAIEHQWLDFDTFDPEEYEFYERVENGDFNWIIPGKILSFCGPHCKSVVENGYPYHAPEVYFDYFRERNVSTIVRLNMKMYEAARFTEAGFDHVDLFFIDGSTPSDEIVERFIDVVDEAKGAVAIHCKAGLGRTGTLIACWMMKEFGLTAAECMGWMRVCRPGSVIGPQQEFLVRKQKFCWSMANNNLIVQLPMARKGKRTDSERSEGKGVTKLTSKVDEIRLCTNGRLNGRMIEDSGSAMNGNGTTTTMASRRPRPNILPMRTSGRVTIDETALDSKGRSQGDRLLAMKVRSQHSAHQQHQPQTPSPTVPQSSSAHGSRHAERERVQTSRHHHTNGYDGHATSRAMGAEIHRIVKANHSTPSHYSHGGHNGNSMGNGSVVPLPHQHLTRLQQQTCSPRFSSPTTPIKPMSSTNSPASPMHSPHRPRLVARNLLASGSSATASSSRIQVPISKVTVTSGGSKAFPSSKSTSALKKSMGIRTRPYPSGGARIEMPPTSNYELRPRRSHSPIQYGLAAARALPPNSEALIGRSRALRSKYSPVGLSSASRQYK